MVGRYVRFLGWLPRSWATWLWNSRVTLWVEKLSATRHFGWHGVALQARLLDFYIEDLERDFHGRR